MKTDVQYDTQCEPLALPINNLISDFETEGFRNSWITELKSSLCKTPENGSSFHIKLMYNFVYYVVMLQIPDVALILNSVMFGFCDDK